MKGDVSSAAPAVIANAGKEEAFYTSYAHEESWMRHHNQLHILIDSKTLKPSNFSVFVLIWFFLSLLHGK